MKQVRLSVVKRMSRDCWMCDSDEESAFQTTMCFLEESNGNVVNLCVEHMDGVVSAALDRHKREAAKKNLNWYETSDEENKTLEQLLEQERQWQDEQHNRQIEEEAEKWATG